MAHQPAKTAEVLVEKGQQIEEVPAVLVWQKPLELAVGSLVSVGEEFGALELLLDVL